MNYRILLEGGVFTLKATLVIDEISRFRIALGSCSEALAVLEGVEKPVVKRPPRNVMPLHPDKKGHT